MDVSSLYPQPNAQPVNPLATIQTLQGLQAQKQAMQLQSNQNALFQQEFGAKQAFGQAVAKNTDANGVTNWNGVAADAAQGPANFLMPQIAADRIAREQGTTALQTSQQALAQARRTAANTALGTLATNPKAQPGDALNAVADLYRTGVLDAPTTQAYISTMPSDPAQFKDWLGQLQKQTLSAGERQALITGTPTSVDTGAGVQLGYISPTTGYNPVANVLKTLSAPELAAPHAWTDAQGVQHQGTMAQYLQATGGGGLNPSVAGPAAAPDGTAPMAGRYPAPQGGPISGPAPGVVEGAQHTAAESAAQGVALQHTADDVPNRKGILNNMLGALAQFTPGPSSESTRTMQAAAGRFGLNWNPNATAAQEEFSKFAKQLAIQQTGALGAGTNDKLEASTGASPNVDLSKLGNEKIIHILQGNEDAIAAKNRAWQAYQQQNGAQSYGKFSAEFNKSFDPRVFQMQYMTRDEQKKIIAGMSPAEKQHFAAAKQTALQLGLGQ